MRERLPADQVEQQVRVPRGCGDIVAIHIDECVRPEPEHELARPPAGARQDPRAGGARKLHGEGTDAAAGAENEHSLPGREPTMLEQCLNRGQAGHRNGGRFLVTQRRGFGREVPRLDRDVLGGRSVAVPVGQPVDGVSDRSAGRAVSEGRDDARYLVGRDDRTTVPPRPVHPRRGPVHLRRREAGSMNLHQDIPDAGCRGRRLFVPEAVGPSSLVSS